MVAVLRKLSEVLENGSEEFEYFGLMAVELGVGAFSDRVLECFKMFLQCHLL